MDIGKPKRIHRVEPVEDPVPRKDSPAKTAPSGPVRKPEPVPAP